MTLDWTKDAKTTVAFPSSLLPGPNARADIGEGEAFDGLVVSIQERGIIVPLIVRPLFTKSGGQRKKAGLPAYEVVAGHRRLAAALKVGLLEVPITVAHLDDAEAAVVAAVENLQREDLTPIEEAEAYRLLRDGAGLNPKDIAARIGFPVARVNGVLRILDLPIPLAAQVDDRFPLGELKWILKIPEEAVLAREQVFNAVAVGQSGKWSFFNLAGILDPEKIAFELAAKPSCLDCPKQRRYQVPPREEARWNWKGETGKGWPEIPVCFDRDCRQRKEQRGRGSGRKSASRTLSALVRAKVAEQAVGLDLDRVVNTYEALKKWRRNRRDTFNANQAMHPQWPFDKEKAPKGHAWALNGLLDKAPDGEDIRQLREACATCPHRRISVDGFVDHQDRAHVLVKMACVKPAKREKELGTIRKNLDDAMRRKATLARNRLWTRDLPRLKKEEGANLIADALLRKFNQWGVRSGGPVVDTLLGTDPETAKLLEGSGHLVEKEVATMRAVIKKTALALYAKDPRKLLLLFALPDLADHIHSPEALAEIVRRRLEVVGLEVDHRRLELIEKGTLGSVRDAIDATTADECWILVGRLTGQHGQKSKAVAVERRLGKLNKETTVE